MFRANETYDFFDVFATKDTEHTQHIYVGPNPGSHGHRETSEQRRIYPSANSPAFPS